MSMPVLTYSCSSCELTAWDAMLWGHRYYLVGRERYQMRVGMGWCHACEALVPSEKRPHIDREARLVQESDRLTQALVDQRRLDGDKGSGWPLYRRDSAAASRLKVQLAATQQTLKQVRKLRKLMQGRISGNRCLACGSDNTFLLPESPVANGLFDNASRLPVKLGCRHPQCGGELMVQATGLCLSVRLTSCAYDLEGRRLEVE